MGVLILLLLEYPLGEQLNKLIQAQFDSLNPSSNGIPALGSSLTYIPYERASS